MNALQPFPDSVQEVSACFGKIAYESASEARKALRRMTRRPNWRAIGPRHRLQPYHCRRCRNWHLGNSDK